MLAPTGWPGSPAPVAQIIAVATPTPMQLNVIISSSLILAPGPTDAYASFGYEMPDSHP